MGKVKRGSFGFITLFFLLLVTGLASAEIIVNGPDQSKVNIGDEIGINGYVLRSDDVLGLLRFELKCGDSSDVLMVKSVSLNAGVKKDFNDYFAILSSEEGICKIKVSLEEQGEIIESKVSSDFEITKTLTGSFKINKEGIQAGEKIHVSGNVFGQDGSAVEGFAIVSLKKEGDIYFSDSVEIKEGILSYDIDTKDVPGGEYTVEVDARNSFGNSIIANAGIFSLISEIEVNAHSEKVHYFPKEKVEITGSASVLGGKLKTGMVYINMGDERYETKLKGGNFDLNFYLLNTIESGKHDIEVRIEDEQGNFGLHSFSIIVDPIPTKIVVVSDKEAINPGEQIVMRLFLRDQASMDIDESITVKVVNEKNEIYYDSVKKTGEEFSVTLAEDVVPGNYFIKGEFGDIESEKLFIVGEVLKLDYSLDGQMLVVKNVGNIPYEGPLQVEMESLDKTSSISKTINLGVGQEISLDLGEDRTTGTYDISVNGEVFESIEVLGVKRTNYFLWMVYGLLTLVIIYLFLKLLVNLKNSKRKKRIKATIDNGRINPVVRPRNIVYKPTQKPQEAKPPVEIKKPALEPNRLLKPKKLNEEPIKKKGFFSKFKKKKKLSNESLIIKDVFKGVDKGWSRENKVKVHDYSKEEDLNKEPKN